MSKEVKEIIKQYQEVIDYNTKQKMWYRNRIYDKCVSVSENEEGEIDIEYLQDFIKHKKEMIEDVERRNDKLRAKVDALNELINEGESEPSVREVIIYGDDVNPFSEEAPWIDFHNGETQAVSNEYTEIEQENKELKSIEEVKEYLVKHRMDEDGRLNLRGLDFGECSVDISSMKVNGNLYQMEQNVKGDLFQDEQKVGGHLFQGYQTVKGDLVQNDQKVGGEIKQNKTKTMTKKEIEHELGYKIIIEEE